MTGEPPADRPAAPREPTEGGPAGAAPQPADRRPASRWTAGRVIGIVLGGLGGLIGLAMLVGGLALIAVHSFARDDDGYLTSGNERLRAPSYAITAEEIDLETGAADWAPEELIGSLRIVVRGETARPVFVGIAREAALARYLDGVRHAEVNGFFGGSPEYDRRPGGAPARPPTAERFWVASSVGRGERVLDWDAEAGLWSIAVMNAGAAPGVAVVAEVGAKLDWLVWAGAIVAVIGLLLTAGAVAVVLLVGRRASRAATDGP